MIKSFECRWMFNEALPSELELWFNELSPEEQAPRTDYYYHQTEGGTLGIKLREGNIQIKSRLGQHGNFMCNSIIGNKESYSKWSFKVEQNSEWSYLIEQPEVWIPVTKDRRMIKFTLDGGYPDQVKMEVRPNQGCEIELSTITIKNKQYWSLAFEAFGPSASDNLEKTLNYIFETKPIPYALKAENSYGYAHLIHQI